MYIAQLDLTKAFDRISHDSIAEMSRPQKPPPTTRGCALQLVVLQFTGSPFGTRYFRPLYLCGQGVPQGARESPLVFVTVADEILGGLRLRWGEKQFRGGHAMKCPSVAWDTLTTCSSSPDPRLRLRP